MINLARHLSKKPGAVHSIYIYDTLGMPEGFWLSGQRPSPLKAALLRTPRRPSLTPLVRGTRVEGGQEPRNEAFRRYGPLYVYMIRTWSRVFTPAVFLALSGFIALVLDTNDWKIRLGAAASLVAVGVLYWLVRPDLGVD